MATQVNTHEAKTQLSRLLARVRDGEEIIIAKAGEPIARLVPFEPIGEDRAAGTAREKLRIASDFDDPIPEEILRTFHS